MRVDKITTTGFRNLADVSLEPESGVNILCGNNAQGKTNLLEAIFLCTGSRSFRGAKDAELLTFGAPAGLIAMDYEAAGRSQQIRLKFDGTRKAEHNGLSLDSPAVLSGEFCAVIFSPEHLALVKEGPQQRRRFIDAAICQLMPRYVQALAEYRKALFQRNALLKDIPRHASLTETLDIWDERLSRTGAYLVFTRLRYLRRLAGKAAEYYRDISKNGESLEIRYLGDERVHYDLDLADQAAAIRRLADELCAAMKNGRKTEIETGYSHVGPHRDDLDLLISGISAKAFGSQGQQRTAALSLKLAEATVLWETLNDPPVLLLDDVMSELDASRQDYLLNNIEGMQVFITCCDSSWQKLLRQSAVFQVKAGRITKTDPAGREQPLP